MTKIDAAVKVIREAGYDALATDFRTKPRLRAVIALTVGRDVTRRMGRELGERTEKLLLIAAGIKA
jgi:hypothetical protein